MVQCLYVIFNTYTVVVLVYKIYQLIDGFVWVETFTPFHGLLSPRTLPCRCLKCLGRLFCIFCFSSWLSCANSSWVSIDPDG